MPISEEEARRLLDELQSHDTTDVNAREASELEEAFPNGRLTSNYGWGFAPDEDGHYQPALAPDAAKYKETDEYKEKSEKRKAERAAERRRITEEALNGSSMMLNAPLTREDKKKAIELYTHKYTERMGKDDYFIRSLICGCLSSSIPNDLMQCYRKYPGSVARFPGFRYKAGLLWGGDKGAWVEPDIPLYFKPEDCQHIVEEMLSPKGKKSLDGAIKRYATTRDARSRVEVSLARRLLDCDTYYDLLKANPFIYELLRKYHDSQIH